MILKCNERVRKTNKFNKLYNEHVVFLIDDPAKFLAPEWSKKREAILKTAKFSEEDEDKRIEAILLIGSLADTDDNEAIDVLLNILANEKNEENEVIVQVAQDAYDVLKCR